MKTGQTSPKNQEDAARVTPLWWLELETVSLSARYHYIDNSEGQTIANNNQYQVTVRGRLRFDRKGKYSVNAGVFTGNSFSGGWNASGWGTGRSRSNLYLKLLYATAKPVEGVALQYGGLHFEYGESTEITSYDFDGYLTGQRLKLTRPRALFFDEVSITYGYVGDLTQPGINKRFHRLTQSNYHQFLVARRAGARTRVSVDYTFESGVDTFREAAKVTTPEFGLIDTLRFETYQRSGDQPGYGFSLYGEKAINDRLTIGGGFASIDRSGLNSDRFPRGKRLFLNSLLTVNSELSLNISFTQAVSNPVTVLPRSRLDLALSYNLLQTLRKARLF